MSGFRVALGGAQAKYDVKPDLTTLGKVIGGGMPVGAFGGRADIMDFLAPLGPVYQAGTLSGNPVAMSAGLTTLEILSQPGFFDRIIEKTTTLLHGIQKVADENTIPLKTNQEGTMFGIFFSEKPVHQFCDATQCNLEQFKYFHRNMLASGIYLAPSAYEAGFMSSAHSDEDIAQIIKAAGKTFSSMTA